MSHEAKYFTKDGIELDRETWLREYAAELAFAVGGDGPTQITPATDEEIARIIREIDAGTQGGIRNVLSLIARIRKEQEWSRKRADDIITLGREVGVLTEERDEALAVAARLNSGKELQDLMKLNNGLRERTIRECAEIAIREPPLLTTAHGPRPQKRIHDKILALLESDK